MTLVCIAFISVNTKLDFALSVKSGLQKYQLIPRVELQEVLWLSANSRLPSISVVSKHLFDSGVLID